MMHSNNPSFENATARAEPAAAAMAGTLGDLCQTCSAPFRVQLFYDDPFQTPITELKLRLFDRDQNLIAGNARTFHTMNFGAEEATPSVIPIHQNLGLYEHGDVPLGPVGFDTGELPDIESAADEAWEIENDIVGGIWDFELGMKRLLSPIAAEWNAKGWMGVPGAFASGFQRAVAKWWESEKDFWGTTWGWLKSTTAGIAREIWDRVTSPFETLEQMGRAGWEGAQKAYEMLTDITNAFRELLKGDVHGFFEKLGVLGALEIVGGALGEFGKLVKDVIASGVEWKNALNELIRRTPVLGLLASTIMRIVLLMTPNFWAELAGLGGGFVVPELLIWLICILIGALASATGAGAAPAVATLVTRAASVASKVRALIKGSGRTFAALMRFMDLIQPIVAKIKPLAQKLRASIREVRSGIVDRTQRLFRPVRYFRNKLDDIARGGPGAHGPQRHEGDVTVKQLDDRILYGKDPMTGTTVDGVHGGTHGYGAVASKVKTPADYVRAYEKAIKHPLVKADMDGGEAVIRHSIPIEKLLGSEWRARILARQRLGTKTNPTGVIDYVYGSDAKMFVMFKKNTDGSYYLYTMYPK